MSKDNKLRKLDQGHTRISVQTTLLINTNTGYNDKIRYNDNLTVKKPPLNGLRGYN